jgi:hypothetical protein
MTAAERLVLILTADLAVSMYSTPATYRDELVKRLKEARHALDAEAYWATRQSEFPPALGPGLPVPPILTEEPDPDAA